MPDREAKQWVQTHPKGQIQAATDKNKATNGYYVQVVKLMKFWRDRLPTESCKLKSYILEIVTPCQLFIDKLPFEQRVLGVLAVCGFASNCRRKHRGVTSRDHTDCRKVPINRSRDLACECQRQLHALAIERLLGRHDRAISS